MKKSNMLTFFAYSTGFAAIDIVMNYIILALVKGRIRILTFPKIFGLHRIIRLRIVNNTTPIGNPFYFPYIVLSLISLAAILSLCLRLFLKYNEESKAHCMKRLALALILSSYISWFFNATFRGMLSIDIFEIFTYSTELAGLAVLVGFVIFIYYSVMENDYEDLFWLAVVGLVTGIMIPVATAFVMVFHKLIDMFLGVLMDIDILRVLKSIDLSNIIK